MIHFVVLVPLILAGGLAGLAHERIRRKRLAPRLAAKPIQSAVQLATGREHPQVVRIDELGPVRYSERAAYMALGLSTYSALFYPPLGVVSLPIIGYSAFNWLRARMRLARKWYRSPSSLLAIAAFALALGTGHWVLASLVLCVDLVFRRWASNSTETGSIRARSALSRRGNSLRVALFLSTNIAILLLLSVVLAVLGIAPVNLLRLSALALVFGMSGSFLSLALSKWIAKLSTGARVIKEVGNDTEQWLVDTVARHARRAGIGMPEVAVYGSPDMNAFATGMMRNRALVAVSTGLLARMTPDEIEAVLGHELAHVANGDMVTLALIQGVLDTFVIFISRVVAGVIDGLTRTDRGDGLGGMGYWILVFVLQLTLGLLALLIVMWFARQREYRADAGGAELAGPDSMIAALERLRSEGEQSQLPDRLAAFGINARSSRLVDLLSSHPPLADRIARLRARSPRPISSSRSDDAIEVML